MSEDVFQRYSAYYDLLYGDKDYEAEADYVARTLRGVNPDTKTILEFGSGTGRHGRLLGKREVDVFGIERSGTMVNAAQSVGREHRGFTCVQGDIRTIKLNKIFDAVLALFHVVSYQTNNADVIRTFENAAHHLSAGGVFFFDVWHAPAVLHERPSVREKHVEDETTRLTRIAYPELDNKASTVTVRYSMVAESKTNRRVTKFEEEHRMRYFFPEEINSFASTTGFHVERSEEFLTGNKPSNRTWGVAYLLRKCSSDL